MERGVFRPIKQGMPLVAACLLAAPVNGSDLMADKGLAREEAQAMTLDAVPHADRSLYVLSIGINGFDDAKIFDLAYAEQDAKAITELFQNAQYASYGAVHVTKLLSAEATRAAVSQALQDLANKARRQDTVIIFFSSHGMQQDGGKTFWVLNDTQIDQRDYHNQILRIQPETALEQGQIQHYLDAIPAQRLLVLIDSCFSADTVISKRRNTSYAMERPRNPFDAFQGKGWVVVTASQGHEKSFEAYKYGHGIFTHYLLEGLRGQADANQDNVIEVWEIWDYLRDRVTTSASALGRAQQPTISAIHLTHGFPLTTYPLTQQPAPAQPAITQPPIFLEPAMPHHPRVNIGLGRMAAFEVTNAEYLAFVRAQPQWRRDRIAAAYHDGDYLKHWSNADSFPSALADHPVTYVSWFAAKAYAEWVGGHLPTEHQWITAALGSVAQSAKGAHVPMERQRIPDVSGASGDRLKDRLYPFGAQRNPLACNARDAGLGRTAMARSYADYAVRWPEGEIANMAGNVWEWNADWAFAQMDGEINHTSGVERPFGEASAQPVRRLIKGGSFLADRVGCLITSRAWVEPTLCTEDGGFRVMWRRDD